MPPHPVAAKGIVRPSDLPFCHTPLCAPPALATLSGPSALPTWHLARPDGIVGPLHLGTVLAVQVADMWKRIPKPVQILALLAVLALGSALGVNALVAKLLTVDPSRLAAARSSSPPPAAMARNSEPDAAEEPQADAAPSRAEVAARGLPWYKRPILARNIFDSAASGTDYSGDDEGPGEGEVTRQSTLDATLLATAVAIPREYSTALISTGSGMPDLYRIGEPLLTATIHDILRPTMDRPARIIVMNNGELEFIEVGGKKAKGRDHKRDAKKPTKGAKKRGGRHTWDGISDLGGNRYAVEKGELDYALGNLDKLSREARVVPNFADGQTNGFKIFSIRRNSAPRKLGLKNNDVLTAINGNSLGDMSKAMSLYSKLSSESSFTLEVLRNGEPVTLEYEVR